jgi:O-antigen/teichoic acid export membrane protein
MWAVERLTSGTLWNALAAIASQGSVFIAHLLLANLVGRQAFGQFSLVATTVNTLAGTSQLAMASMATKYVAEFRHVDPAGAGRVANLAASITRWTGIAVGIALLLLAGWVSERVFNVPDIRQALTIAALAVTCTVWCATPIGILAGLEDFRKLAIAAAVGGIAYLTLVPLLGVRLGVTGASGAIAAATVLRWAVTRIAAALSAAASGIPYAGKLDFGPTERRILTRFAVPAALSGSTTLPALWLATAILSRRADGTAEVALANAALAIKNLVVFIPGMIGAVTMAVMNNALGNNHHEIFRSAFRANLAATIMIVALLGAGIALTADWVVLLYGTDFLDGATVLRVMMWVAVFEGIGAAAYQVIQSHGLMWRSFLTIVLPRDCLIVLLAVALVPTYGATGFAAAYAIAWGAGCVVILITTYYLQPDLLRPQRRHP